MMDDSDEPAKDRKEVVRIARLTIDTTPEDYADKAEGSGKHGSILSNQLSRTNSTFDFDEAIRVTRWSADTHTKDLCRDLHLKELRSLLYHRYLCRGDVVDLEEAIKLAKDALEINSNKLDLAICLMELGDLLHARYARTDVIADIEEAIQAGNEMVAATPNSRGKVANIDNLKYHQNGQHLRIQAMGDLEKAIQLSRRGLDILPNDHPERPAWLNNLGIRYFDHYASSKSLQDLEEAILLIRQSLDDATHTTPHLTLVTLATLLGTRYLRIGATTDIEEAIKLAHKSLNIASDNLHICLKCIADGLFGLYQMMGTISNLDEAIRFARQAVKKADNNLDTLTYSDFLGDLLFDRYEKTGVKTDLGEAIHMARQVASLIFFDDRHFTTRLSFRGLLMSNWYRKTRTLADYDKVIQAARQPANIPIAGLTQVKSLNKLRLRLFKWHKKTRNIAELTEAITITRHIIDIMPNDPDRSYLSCRLYELYHKTHDSTTLDEATKVARQLVNATLKSPHRAVYLDNLGNILSSRCQITGDTAELDEAVKIGIQAVEMIPDGDKLQAVCLHTLGRTYFRRYCITQAKEDLNKAIGFAQEAVNTALEDSPFRARFLGDLSYGIMQCYRLTTSMADLERAINLGRQAADAVQNECLEPEIILDRLGVGLYERYLRMYSVTDLDDAIRLGRQAADLTRLESSCCQYLASLASLLCEQHVRTGSIVDLEEAIKLAGKARFQAEADCLISARILCHLGHGKMGLWKMQCFLDVGIDQDKAREIIRHGGNAVAVMSKIHPLKARYLTNISFWLIDRFRVTGSMIEIEEAIRLGREAVDVTHRDHPDLPWCLCCLAFGLGNRFYKTGQPDDLEEAIRLGRRAVDITSADFPGRPFYLIVLAIVLFSRYSATGRLPDLYKSIRLGLEGLDLLAGDTPGDKYIHLCCLSNLSVWFSDKYLREGTMADLDEAIRFRSNAEEILDDLKTTYVEWSPQLVDISAGFYAMHLTTKNNAPHKTTTEDILHTRLQDFPDCATRLQNLGSKYFGHFLRTRKWEDLSTALSLCKISVRATPPGNIARLVRLRSLGKCHEAYYFDSKHFGGHKRPTVSAIDDLSNAIELFQEVIDTASRDNPTWVSTVHNLGSLYEERFGHTKDLADFKMLLELYQESVDITPKSHSFRATRLQSLGRAKLHSARMFEKMSVLEEALKLLQEALNITPLDSPFRAEYLTKLGDAYFDKYTVTKEITDLEVCLQLYQGAVEIKPDHKFLPQIFSCLGRGHLEQYMALGAKSDFQRAVQILQNALDATSRESPHRAYRLADLAQCYLCGHRKESATTYIEMAARFSQEAADATTREHAGRSAIISSLGNIYSTRYNVTKSKLDLEVAIEAYNEVFWDLCDGATNDEFLSVAQDLISLLIVKKDWDWAWVISSNTMSLMRSYTPRFLDSSERQVLLSRQSGWASYTAAIALSSGRKIIDALRLLEQGRGIAAEFIGELRADVSSLMKYSPEHGKEFLNLRDRFEAPVANHTQQTGIYPKDKPALHGVSRRLAASRRLDKFIDEFRSQNRRLNPFLDTPSDFEPTAAAESGPIVVINISYRCDAFLVKRDGVQMLPLPTLSREDIIEKGRKGNFGDAEVLEWLWDTITSPILDALGFLHPSQDGDHWPHVWWVPTGPLSGFPLHAAGRHAERSNKTVLDRVMSSYGLSIRTIQRSRRQHAPQEPNRSAKAVIVAMEHTPDSTYLPFAAKEAAMIRGLCKSMSLEPTEPRRCRQEVTSHLQGCEIFHFAGHGSTDARDPLKSYLRLEDWKDTPLTVADLLEINVRESRPFLAYLSACGTGRINDKKYLDESVHLISACQLAGFRHVIGTLWEVNDETCVDMARITYEGMRDGNMTDESVCRGLHKASRELRNRWLDASSSSARTGSIVELEGSLAENRSTSGAEVSDLQLPRDVAACDEDGLGLAYWVPYVHFGVSSPYKTWPFDDAKMTK